MRIATIIARQEFALARTLGESIIRHMPRVELAVLVLDPVVAGDGGAEDGHAEVALTNDGLVEGLDDQGIELLSARQLQLEGFPVLAGTRAMPELREAIKPQLVRRLLDRDPTQALLYLDPDSLVCGSLAEIERLADEHGLLLWPRTGSSLPPDGRRPNEADLRGWGLYDAGQLAFGAGHAHGELLDWWERRAPAGRDQDAGAPPVDRLATIAPSHREIREVALGASFWNLYGHALERGADGPLVDGASVRLLRLIDFDPDRAQELSGKQDRIRLADHEPLARLLRDYAERLIANGHPSARELPYGWDALPDGTRLDQRLRDIYARAVAEASLRASIFTRAGMEEFYAWLAQPAPEGAAYGINRLCWLVREAQPQLREGYPTLDDADQAAGYIGWLHAYGTEPGTLPSELVPPLSPRQQIEQRARLASAPWGVNVAGYFRSELGVGQAARLTVAALDTVEVTLLPVHGRSVPSSRQEHEFTSLDADAARFPVNLVCVNADGLPGFREEVGERFFAERYTIGMWWWEVSSFPDAMRGSFSLLDEVWVGSEHVAGALMQSSPVPVYRVTLPVLLPHIERSDRGQLGLPLEGALFLFMFDYHSVFERKNPLAVVEAFKRAFPPGSGAALALKCTNSADDPSNHARLRAAVDGHPDIHLLEGYMAPSANDALIAACDCYVSLHRSEGFGLTPAEAMALGKPVIATGYSGNLDYMSERNAYLVDYELVPVGPGNAPYPAEAQWADPSIEHAAQLMREVLANPVAASGRGERARADLARTHSLQAAGRSMAIRLESIRARMPQSTPTIEPFQPGAWPPAADDSRSLRSRIARYLAREQLHVLDVRIAELHSQLVQARKELDELRHERVLDAEQAQRDIALLQAEVLASLRRQQASG
jgi:glycosyltransferase involved in cell wall biosynthesis